MAMNHGGPPDEFRQFTTIDIETTKNEIFRDVVAFLFDLLYGSPLERLSLGCSSNRTIVRGGLQYIEASWKCKHEKLSPLQELSLRDFDLLSSYQLLFDTLEPQKLHKLTLFSC